MALAASPDVVARLGRPLTTDETARVTGLLDEASELVRGWMRCVPDPVPDAVKIVVSRMVARVFAAGSSGVEPGVANKQMTAGVYGITRAYSADATSGGVWLTKQDKTMLRPYGCRGHVGNVGTSRF